MVTSKLCMRKNVGLNGNLFGGDMLAWTDEAAYIFASKITNHHYTLVTKRFGEIIFKRAVKEGDIVDFIFTNVSVGTTSISFDIIVNVRHGLVFSTSVTFVALDNYGNKTKIDKDKIKLKRSINEK